MDKLQYHLTVHNPFRLLEGFCIDIKVSIFRRKFANIIQGNELLLVDKLLRGFFIDINEW